MNAESPMSICDVARLNGEKRLSQSLEVGVDRATMEKSVASWTGLDSVSNSPAVRRDFRRVVAARASRLSNRPRSFSPVQERRRSLVFFIDPFFPQQLAAFSSAELDWKG